MHRKRVTGLIVVDKHGKYLGMADTADIHKRYPDESLAIRDVMRTDTMTLSPDTPLADAIGFVQEAPYGYVAGRPPRRDVGRLVDKGQSGRCACTAILGSGEERGAMSEVISVMADRWPDIVQASWEHIVLSVVALFWAIVVAVPTGILLTRYRKLVGPVLAVISVFQTIPSLALLGFMIPLFGIGPIPAVIAMVIYALLPIVRNTYRRHFGRRFLAAGSRARHGDDQRPDAADRRASTGPPRHICRDSHGYGHDDRSGDARGVYRGRRLGRPDPSRDCHGGHGHHPGRCGLKLRCWRSCLT